jgi:hypothetical protein
MLPTSYKINALKLTRRAAFDCLKSNRSSTLASLVSEVNGSKKIVLSMVPVHSTSELKVIGSELGGLDESFSRHICTLLCTDLTRWR